MEVHVGWRFSMFTKMKTVSFPFRNFEKAKYILKSRSSSVIPNIMRYWKPHNFQMTLDVHAYYIYKKKVD